MVGNSTIGWALRGNLRFKAETVVEGETLRIDGISLGNSTIPVKLTNVTPNRLTITIGGIDIRIDSKGQLTFARRLENGANEFLQYNEAGTTLVYRRERPLLGTGRKPFIVDIGLGPTLEEHDTHNNRRAAPHNTGST